MLTAVRRCCVIARDNNVVRVNFGREPDPPTPKFPGSRGLRAEHVYESEQVGCDTSRSSEGFRATGSG